MLYRKRRAFVLAIHGCPVWPVMGIPLADAASRFSLFAADGGTFRDCMSSAPSITQTLDATGGFGRLSDTAFEFIDDGSFTGFFGANRIESVYSYLTAALTYAGTMMTVNATGAFADNDLLYLPRETVRVGSIDTETEMAITRSIFSAFTEGKYPTYNAIPPQMAGRGPDVAKGGHWNHAGRWVCLYQLNMSALGIWSTPKRIYAGVISEVAFTGRKISLSTRSITSLLATPIIQQTDLQMNVPADFYAGEAMTLKDLNGRTIATLPAVTAIPAIFAYLETKANTNAETDGTDFLFMFRPTFAWIQAGGATLPTTADCISLADSHPGLLEYLDVAETPTGSSGIGWRMDDIQDVNWAKYNFIITPGGRFAFAAGAYIAAPFAQDQYFRFDNGERSIIVPCTYLPAQGLWYFDSTDPWFNEDAQELGDAERFLALSTLTAKISPAIMMSTGEDTQLLYFLNQALISTGEGIATYEDGELSWYQALGIPQWLVNSPSFVAINYFVLPLVWEPKSIIDIFEPGLKISGNSVIFATSGKLVARQNPLASEEVHSGHYTSAQVSTEKPSVAIGYQAPLTCIRHSFPRLNLKNSYNMANPQSAFSGGNELALEDPLLTAAFPDAPWIALNALYWLSNTIPSVVIRTDAIVGELGDVVQLDNLYVVSGDGYGLIGRTAMQTEIQTGAGTTARLLLAGNLDLDSFCLLAPAGRLDLAVGDHGLNTGKLYFTSEFDQDVNFVNYIYLKNGSSTGPLDLIVRCHTGHMAIPGCLLDIANGAVIVPAGFAWPARFGISNLDRDWYVTIPEHYRSA